MQLSVPIWNAFVDGECGGNAAGVVLNSERFTPAQKQSIAAQVGLSETAFVSASQMADFRVEFYTPAAPLNDCGHATVAAFAFLAREGLLPQTPSSKELADGTVRAIDVQNGLVWMEQAAPIYTEAAGDVYGVLGLTADDALPGVAPCIVSTGMPCLVVPLRDENAVRAIAPDFDAITRFTNALGGIEVYAFSPDAQNAAHDAGARMFWPAIGIPEEAATGMAAGPLACFLRDVCGVRKTEFVIEQGFLMPAPSPSRLHVELSVVDGRIASLRVGGRARQARTMDVEVH